MAVGTHPLRVRLGGSTRTLFTVASILLGAVVVATLAAAGVSAGWLVLPAIGVMAGDLLLLGLSDD